jgi:glycolate oxidase iron-sulfur subunit
MKAVLEGSVPLDDAIPYIDHCLGCLACQTACPSGVPYGELLMPFRFYAEARRSRTASERLSRWLVHTTLPYPERFRAAAQAGRLAKGLRGALPARMRSMLDLLPDSLPAGQPLPAVYPAQGARRARVALLIGCVQQALEPEINWASLRVLARNGVEVVIPAGQGCCGALALHTGDQGLARRQALVNMQAFPQDVDAILTNAAGCGSGMKEYPLLFAGSEWQTQAAEFAGRSVDISVFLDQLGLLDPPGLAEPLTLAYHDACHLLHAQKVSEPPRRLLGRIPNLKLVSLPETELCCGSAGAYNLEQPETARLLGERKVGHILNAKAQGVVTGNIGCLVQLQNHLNRLDHGLPVWHTIEVLDRAYRG